MKSRPVLYFNLWRAGTASEEYLTDLSDQPWIENCVEGTLVDITKDGKIYGQPLVIETYGFIQ